MTVNAAPSIMLNPTFGGEHAPPEDSVADGDDEQSGGQQDERITMHANDSRARRQCDEAGTSVVLHISDPHFGTERAEVVEALLAFSAEQMPSLVILSGDITQRARRQQFKSARAFVDRFAPIPVLVIPGNHDIPLFNLYARLKHPYANYCRAFGDTLEPQWDDANLQVTCVNTTRPARHVDGEVSPSQCKRVAERLRQAKPGQLRIVVTHQPMHVTRSDDEENLLHGGREAAVAWADAGVDLLLGGHIHLPYSRPLRERHVDLSRDAWVVQAGTAVSDRVRDGVPNSVNLIRHDAERAPHECIVARCDYHATKKRFVPIAIKTILLDRKE